MTSNRIRGVLMGQFVGDALGSRYEFTSASEVKKMISDDMKKSKNDLLPMLGGGPFDFGPGQVTDDSEMALSMIGALLAENRYDQASTGCAYVRWEQSHPPDIGTTTASALAIAERIPEDWLDSWDSAKRNGVLTSILRNVHDRNANSQSNGCLMRISPLPAFYHDQPVEKWARHVAEDVALTHGHSAPVNACLAYTRAIHELIAGKTPQQVYESALSTTDDPIVRKHLELAAIQRTPVPFGTSMEKWTNGDDQSIGYFGVAFQIAFYELLHAQSFAEGLINAIRVGGDTDTNGCITAALLGAHFGENQIPIEWRKTVETAPIRLKGENKITSIQEISLAFGQRRGLSEGEISQPTPSL